VFSLCGKGIVVPRVTLLPQRPIRKFRSCQVNIKSLPNSCDCIALWCIRNRIAWCSVQTCHGCHLSLKFKFLESWHLNIFCCTFYADDADCCPHSTPCTSKWNYNTFTRWMRLSLSIEYFWNSFACGSLSDDAFGLIHSGEDSLPCSYLGGVLSFY